MLLSGPRNCSQFAFSVVHEATKSIKTAIEIIKVKLIFDFIFIMVMMLVLNEVNVIKSRFIANVVDSGNSQITKAGLCCFKI